MHLTLDVGKERSAKQEEHNSGGNENLKFPLHYAIEVAIDNSSWFCSHFSGMRTHLRHCERRLCINLPRGIIF